MANTNYEKIDSLTLPNSSGNNVTYDIDLPPDNTIRKHAEAKGSAFSNNNNPGLFNIKTNDEGHITAATALSTTANRLAWTNSSNLLTADNHYVDASHLVINKTDRTSVINEQQTNYPYNFEVNGNSYSIGKIIINTNNNIENLENSNYTKVNGGHLIVGNIIETETYNINKTYNAAIELLKIQRGPNSFKETKAWQLAVDLNNGDGFFIRNNYNALEAGGISQEYKQNILFLDFATGDATFKGGLNTGRNITINSSNPTLIFNNTISSPSDKWQIQASESSLKIIQGNDTQRIRFFCKDNIFSILPYSSNNITYNLGSFDNKWNNIYTNNIQAQSFIPDHAITLSLSASEDLSIWTTLSISVDGNTFNQNNFIGTNIIQISYNNTYWSGVFSLGASESTVINEIPLHMAGGSSDFTLYLRINGSSLQIKANKAISENKDITIKIKHIM